MSLTTTVLGYIVLALAKIGSCLGLKMQRGRHKRLIYHDVIHAMLTDAVTSHHHPLNPGTHWKRDTAKIHGKMSPSFPRHVNQFGCSHRQRSAGKHKGQLSIYSDCFGVCTIFSASRKRFQPEKTLNIDIKRYE